MVREDVYSKMATNRVDVKDIKPGIVRVCKTVVPIERRKPNKMPSLGEMLRYWGNIDQSLYNRIISLYNRNT